MDKFFKTHEYNIDGYQVYVGKDASSNDYLTFRFAQANDYWFHVKGSPGSHVVLQVQDNEEPTKDTIKKVASLAAYHSKQRNGGKVKVNYTYCKNVSKYKGAKAGSVVINKEKVVQVRPMTMEE